VRDFFQVKLKVKIGFALTTDSCVIAVAIETKIYVEIYERIRNYVV